MAKKKKDDEADRSLTADEIDAIVEFFNKYLGIYKSVATQMRENQIYEIKAGGLKTIEERVIHYLRGHTGVLEKNLRAEIDAHQIAKIAEQRENYSKEN